jgi:hypothetical protein
VAPNQLSRGPVGGGAVCLRIGVSGAIARLPSKSQKISKKSLMSLVVIS